MDTAYDSLMEQIAQSIFSTMLNIELARVDEHAPADHQSLVAAVQIAGQWMGSAVLSLSPEAALEAAAAMLQLDPAEVTDEDRKEVAAELVNMIGGNLKSTLPGPSYLSLPTVVAGREFGVQVHHAVIVDEVGFRTECGALRVRLYAKTQMDAC